MGYAIDLRCRFWGLFHVDLVLGLGGWRLMQFLVYVGLGGYCTFELVVLSAFWVGVFCRWWVECLWVYEMLEG